MNRFFSLLFSFGIIVSGLSTAVFATETYHPIQIPLSTVPPLVGKPIADFGLYAFKNGKLQTIAFQIDQVDPQDKILLPFNGEVPPKKMRLPQFTTRRDLLLWMPEDMGEAYDLKKIKTTPSETWLEINISPSAATQDGHFVYVRIAPDQTLSPKDYVTYDRENDLVRTPSFFIGYRDIIIINRFGWISKDGSLGENLLHRVAVRFSAKALFGLFPIEITENDIVSRVVGFKDGPIRVLKRVTNAPRLPLGMKGPASETDCFFYRNSYQTQVAVDFPVGGKAILSDAKFRIYIDLPHFPEPLNLEMPNAEHFTIRPDLIPQDFLVSKTPMTWIHYFGKDIPNHFVTYLQVAPGDLNVFSPRDLNYLHLGDKQTMGTLYVDIDLLSRSGMHQFSLHLFAPSIGEKPFNTEHLMGNIKTDMAAQYHVENFRPL